MKKMINKKYFSRLFIINSFIIFTLVMVNTSLRLLLPYILSKFIDAFSIEVYNYNSILVYTVISISLLITCILQKYYVEKLSWNMINHMRTNLMKIIFIQKENFYIKYSNSDLLEYFEVDIDKIYRFISITLPSLITNVITIVFVIGYLSFKSLYILAFFILYMFIDIISIKYYSKNNQGWILEESNYHEQMDGKYGEWLQLKNLPSILGKATKFHEKFDNLQYNWLKYRINANKYYYAIWCISLFLNAFADIFVLGISGFLFFKGIISIGNVYLYYSYGKRIQEPMENLQQQFQFGRKCYFSLKRLDNLYSLNNTNKFENQKIYNKINCIECKNLNFHYSNGVQVLKNINLKLNKGETVGIYGKSGDGKSTLCKALLKNVDIQNSMIFVNNIDLCCIETESYLNNVVYFDNKPFIANTTLFDNLTMFDGNISKEYVEKKLIEYNLLSFIDRKLNIKLDSLINPTSISNGQKQIIALCRSFFTQKSFFIFDEAFTDITEEEALFIFNKIKKANKDSIIISVSHQLNKLSTCSKLYNMKGGVLYEETK